MKQSAAIPSTKSSRSRWWFVYGMAALLVGATLIWISIVVLRLEANAQHQQLLRLALWRMDGWLGPLLREESSRAFFEYLPFFPHERSYTRILNAIEPGEVYSPSPLLTYESNYFVLHFQVDSQGGIVSPQVPQGNWRDLAESGYVGPEYIQTKQPLLDRLVLLLEPRTLEACVDASQKTLAQMLGRGTEAVPEVLSVNVPPLIQTAVTQGQIDSQKELSKADLQWRMGSNYNATSQRQQTLHPEVQVGDSMSLSPPRVEISTLLPLWIQSSDDAVHGQAAPELLFVRRVTVGDDVFHQGVLANWPRIRTAMLEQISDLFPNADLAPLPEPTPADSESGRMLGSVPVLMTAPCRAWASGPLITPARTALTTMWVAALAALVAGAITLRASITYGEKRSRFASAVTHELRTPLTTFRMYSEMLAEGMVPDESQRLVYLNTLKTESARLATLVENVLSYSRLEQGRARSSPHPTTGGEMFERIIPPLQRRATSSGMTLSVNIEGGEQAIRVDTDAVGQILFNLIDNACKYAAGNDVNDRVIEIACQVHSDLIEITVRDQGPGISPHHERTIFKPFERGAHQPGDTIPGVGLGLALARGLARDMGGDLKLRNRPTKGGPHGAAFQLTLPL